MKTKKRIAGIALLMAGFGCSRPAQAPIQPTVDAGLKVTDGSVLLLKATAKGVQIYTCKAAADDQSKFVFDAAHAEPDALLMNEAGDMVAHHYFDPRGPAWEASDGSKIVGKKLEPVQVRTGTIPWLKLQTIAHEGTGPLSKVTFIQRLDTEGGVAPAGSCDANARVRIPYKATYYFYAPPVKMGLSFVRRVKGTRRGWPSLTGNRRASYW